MNKLSAYSICFVLFSSFYVKGQNELNYWYFGMNAGIYFDNSGVHATTGNLNVAEGSASISDGCGLLFYTNGDTVWNKNHQMMTNGFGIGGQCTNYSDSRTSTTQPALIVRKPQSDSIYYVFTTDCIEDDLVHGLRYSAINVNKNNGLGEIIFKNQLLHTPVEEKVTAAKHINGCDIWIVTHEWNSNNFYSYLLSSGGLNLTPVISSAGLVHQCYNPLYPEGRGYLKASPNGEKIINVNPDQAYAWCDTTGLPQLFNFNKTNGIVTLDFTFPKDTSYWWQSFSSWTIPFYCTSFSPDNSKLYLGSGWKGPHLFQYDLNAGSPAAIIASKVFLSYPYPWPQPPKTFPSTLTNAPDGKMYIAQRWKTFLGVINNPNSAGLSCNYVDSAFNLALGTAMDWGGLPNFFEDYINPKSLKADFSFSQSNDTIYFTNNSIAGNSFSWNFGDGNSSNTQNSFHVYVDSGFFTVILTARDSLCNMDKKCYTVYVSSPTVINENENDYQISISPNPFSEFLNVKLNSNQHYEIILFDIASRKLLQRIFTSSTTINTSQLAQGIYIYEVRNKNGVIKKGKVVKE